MNKKGFTLIELLAVIVILAIVALIATPAVLNIIEDSRKSAVEETARNISRSAEIYCFKEVNLNKNEITKVDLTTNTSFYKGKKLEKGVVNFNNKCESNIKIYQDGYCVVKEFGGKVTAKKVDSNECAMGTVLITFDANGGELDVTVSEYAEGKKYGELPEPTKEGYGFIGWSTSLETFNEVTTEDIASKSLTLYAMWSVNKYEVTFVYNNDSENTTKEVTYGTAYGELPEPTKEGYIFNGWANESGALITSETIMSNASNHELYAQWAEELTCADGLEYCETDIEACTHYGITSSGLSCCTVNERFCRCQDGIDYCGETYECIYHYDEDQCCPIFDLDGSDPYCENYRCSQDIASCLDMGTCESNWGYDTCCPMFEDPMMCEGMVMDCSYDQGFCLDFDDCSAYHDSESCCMQFSDSCRGSNPELYCNVTGETGGECCMADPNKCVTLDECFEYHDQDTCCSAGGTTSGDGDYIHHRCPQDI